MNSIIGTRGRSLEEAFFRQREQELIAVMKRDAVIAERRKILAEASGITEPQILDEFYELGLHAEALASIALVPIIEVVWADGHMHPEERRAVLAGVEKHGIAKDSPAHVLVEHWLHKRPGPRLLKLWGKYMLSLLPTLSTEGQHLLKKSVIGHSRAVAEAVGGFLGLSRISLKEQAMLNELEQIFESAEKLVDSCPKPERPR